jgi:hypothetical protein
VGRQKHLLVVAAGIVPGLDVDEGELPGVGAAIEVGHGHDMRMYKTCAGGLGRHPISDMALRGELDALFFGRSIKGRRDDLPMPVDEFRSVRVVEQIHCYGDTFVKPD